MFFFVTVRFSILTCLMILILGWIISLAGLFIWLDYIYDMLNDIHIGSDYILDWIISMTFSLDDINLGLD